MGRTVTMNFRVTDNASAIFRRQASDLKISLTELLHRYILAGLPRRGMPDIPGVRLECPAYPSAVVHLQSREVAYIIEVDNDQVTLLVRGARRWNPNPVQHRRSYLFGIIDHEERRRLGIRKPSRALRAAALKWVQRAEPNTFKPRHRSKEEELRASPDARLRLGLCVQCEAKLTDAEKAGDVLCKRCRAW